MRDGLVLSLVQLAQMETGWGVGWTSALTAAPVMPMCSLQRMGNRLEGGERETTGGGWEMRRIDEKWEERLGGQNRRRKRIRGSERILRGKEGGEMRRRREVKTRRKGRRRNLELELCQICVSRICFLFPLFLIFLTHLFSLSPSYSSLFSPYLSLPSVSPLASPFLFPLFLSPFLSSSLTFSGWKCGENGGTKRWIVSLDWTTIQRRESI